jgi:superfamily II DNA/RNA helicase
MSKSIDFQKQILKKLHVSKLNPMQEEAKLAIGSTSNTILLSPTGTGKTLGFLLPLLSTLDADTPGVQLLIILPSRELALQIEQVIRNMGAGFKVNAFYGGRSFNSDRLDLKHPPTILVGTPGRIADHLRRTTFDTSKLTTLVLDEFDKSLEVGFEKEMKEITTTLTTINKRVLTSATQGLSVPEFVGMQDAVTIDYLEDTNTQLTLKTVISPTKDKLETLANLLCHIGNQPGIVFCNYKDSIQRVSDYLASQNIGHGCFYGGMDQFDRELSLVKFRNGTHQLILATDLAARGLDIPQLKFIIHYQLPHRAEEFTHRNGRTARMNEEGTAYVLKWEDEYLPEFIKNAYPEKLIERQSPEPSPWRTLHISGGRREKISKGDIAGLFFKQGQLQKEELGMIELKQDCAFVAVVADKINSVISLTNNSRLKKKKVRISII